MESYCQIVPLPVVGRLTADGMSCPPRAEYLFIRSLVILPGYARSLSRRG
jgi:hypothetical protein